MQAAFSILRTTAVVALAVVALGAKAQGLSYSLQCQSIGASPPEPLGDSEGHAISSGDVSCRVEDGPLAGGVMTGTHMYEWNKGTGVTLAGSGIVRKPGATTTYRIDEGRVTLTMVDGKVRGSTGSGKGVYTMAIGTAAALNGKAFTYTTRTTAPGQFLLSVQVQ